MVKVFAKKGRLKGHNSIIIKYKVLPLSIHVCIVCGNVCTKFHVMILNVFLIMAMVKVFAQFSSRKRGMTHLLLNIEYCPLVYMCALSVTMCVLSFM